MSKKDQVEETKEVAIREDAPPPAEYTGVPGGMEDLDNEDMILPVRRIVQPTSAEGTQGTFRDNLTGEEFETMNVVFLSVKKGRIMFDADDLKAPPLCGSDDRKAPAGFFEASMNGDSCNGCAQMEWTRDEEGKRVPPACSETYNLVGIDTESGMPFLFSAKSSAYNPMKKCMSGIKLKAIKAKKNMWDFSVPISLKKVDGAKGKFFVPVFGVPAPVEGESYAEDANAYGNQVSGGYQGDPKPDEDEEAIPF